MSREFKKIRPSQISIDPRFNRDLDEPRARSMARSLDAKMIGVPVVSRRADGSCIAIDGQHRTTACKIANFDEPVLCEVYEGLTLQQEADLFLRLNGGRRAIRMFDKWKAQLVARDPVALDIDKILRGVGLRVTKASAKNGVCAIQALVAVYHRKNLPLTMVVIMDWSDGDAAYLEGILIRSMSMFLGKYPSLDVKDLVKKLRSHSADRVISRLRKMRGAFDDVSPAVAACSVFRDIYNVRRSKKTQLPSPDMTEVEEQTDEAAE